VIETGVPEMILRRSLSLLTFAVAALFVAAIAAETAQARVTRVRAGESIQAALDAASDGDTILVDPGTYQEDPSSVYGLRITQNRIRLIGRSRSGKGKGKGDSGKVRILANGDQETGIYAAPAGCEYKDSSCADTLEGFYVRGFTVEGFPVNGIQTRWVDGFSFVRNESVNNLNNGIYPTLSANGLVANNVSYGSLDTAMWVAGSENVRVVGNEVYGSPIGLEITVSNDVRVWRNDIHDNTVGVGLFHPNAAGNPPLPEMADWVIERNHIHDNNLPNPAPPQSFQAGVPPGVGVLMLGVSDHVVRRNRIDGNEFVGVAMMGWCTAVSLGDPARNCINDPPIWAVSSDNNLVAGNRMTNNGTGLPPIPLPPVDFIYINTPEAGEPGVDNCFRRNRPEDFTFFAATADGQLPTDGC